MATHVSARGMLDFAVLFGLVWVAWFNGTQFHELHGREDGRGRTFIFLQMGILAVVAVYLIVVSALVVDDDLRLGLRALVVGGAIGLGLAQGLVTPLTDYGLAVTGSMVGLFVIIVLGEVVVGVVNGINGPRQARPTTPGDTT